MRISDWSSDVCSSDLEVRTALSDLVCAGLIVPKDAVDGSIYVFRHALLQQAAQRTLLRERSQQLHALIGQTMEKRNPKAPRPPSYREIGRASCRERVCQYV